MTIKLKRLKVERFKKIRNVELELADVNILVGANGSGKSSIIQAVHLACCVMRQADRVDSSRTSTVGVDVLDYLPTDDYKTLGHNSQWGNNAGTSSSKVTLTFSTDSGTDVQAYCELRSARNAGISILGSVPSDLTQILRKQKSFFSAYIPGISGIPNREEKRSTKIIKKACSFGDSNVVLRNALLLLKLNDEHNIREIEAWVSEIVGKTQIRVNHDDERDQYIQCAVTYQNVAKPLELAGTGFLQLIQVFCYVLLFAPGILLIDEPDIHLHPTVQEKFVSVLARIAKDRGIKVVMTTHSPFVVRAAPGSAMVYWLENGARSTAHRRAIELAMGWGAFGKKVILVSEDSDLMYMKALVAQWPDVDRSVAFYPGNGFRNLPTPDQAQELVDVLGGKYKVIVHRDRDALTDDEAVTLRRKYAEKGIVLWLTEGSDIEAYFCTINVLSRSLGCAPEDAQTYIDAVLSKHATPIREQFNKQRRAINDELHADGGSLSNDSVWSQLQVRPLRGAKGKFVLKQLKTMVGQQKLALESVVASGLDGSVAAALRTVIEQSAAGV